MPDVGYIALVVAGFGAYWWRHMRPLRPPRPRPDLLTSDADIALHVALHEASTRRQELSALHVLYGLLQDDEVTAAIRTAEGDPDAIEDRVLAALADPCRELRSDGPWIVGHAATVARRGGRQASCTDLWAALGETEAARLLDAGKLDRGAVLFALFHGGREPEIAPADDRDVFVVLRNDHYTTQQFVCSMLRDVFALPEADAASVMLATHTTGRAVVGRLTAAEARAKIRQARALARGQAFPLWIGVEPA
ncbi:MAG TPA: ATP-dependent Clp protease adaptor ClpS [Kofleriaceae bacterium]|nr:ATP-dependent Clp protease adaptor ClpS [Kofleriaceae bacterium]